MSVRAKFRVVRTESTSHKPAVKDRDGNWTQLPATELRTIVLAPVYSDDPDSENRRFWNASPSGEIKLGTVNPAAWEQFELDGEYYVTFDKAGD